MKILWLAHRDPLNPKRGGSELIIYEVGKRLVKYGNDVTILSGGWKNCEKILNLDGIKIIRFGSRVVPHIALPLILLRNRYDIVIADLGHAVPWVSPILINGGNKVKMTTFLLGASFFLAYGVELYPLIAAFFLAVYLFIGLPIAFHIQKLARFFYIIIIELTVFFLTYPSIMGLLFASYGSGPSLNSIGTFHVTNLIFYPSAMMSPYSARILFSVSGLNSVYYKFTLILAAILISTLIVLVLLSS